MAVVWPSKNNFANGDVLTAANMNNIGDTLNVFNPTSATNGQIWVANGSGSGAYSTVVTGGMTSLASGSLPAGTGTLTLSGISASYNSLRLILSAWSGTSTGELQVRVNNISTSNYATLYWYGVSTANTQNVFAGTYIPVGNYATTAAGTSTFVLDFPSYSQTTKPMVLGYNVGSATAGTGWGQGWSLGQYDTAAVVNRIDVILSTGNYDAGTYVLYGIK